MFTCTLSKIGRAPFIHSCVLSTRSDPDDGVDSAKVEVLEGVIRSYFLQSPGWASLFLSLFVNAVLSALVDVDCGDLFGAIVVEVKCIGVLSFCE